MYEYFFGYLKDVFVFFWFNFYVRFPTYFSLLGGPLGSVYLISQEA
jgi:hypothetical protein